MFTAAIDAGKWFFMKQADQIMSCRYLLHDFHRKLVMVRGNIGRRINRRQLVLGRRHLVMFRLRENTELPEFIVQVFHISGNSRFNNTEIVIVHFLSLWRFCSEQCPSGKMQIPALFCHRLIYQEVFLFRTYGCTHTFYRIISKKMEDTERLLIQSFH